MIKVVSVIQRKPGTTVEAFQQYWRHQHAAIVSRLPGLRRYVQSHTLLAGYRKSVPAADGIAELWFDDLAAMQALKGSAALTAVLADEPAFIDPTTHVQTLTTEHVIKNGAVPHDGVKNIEFVTKKAGMAVADFQRHWITMHGFALNVCGDLSPFHKITPCGISGVEMTSLDRERGASISVREVAETAGRLFDEAFDRLCPKT